MNTFSRSVTFAPFVKGMPAFLHVLYSAIFDADCTQYHVIFITDLFKRQGKQSDRLAGLTERLTLEEKNFLGVSIALKGATKHYANV